MKDILEIIESLPEMEFLAPVSESEIKQAEMELKLTFSEEYRKYLLTFGAVWSDIIALSGIIDDEDYSVVELTKKIKSLQPNIPEDFYVIEDVGVDGLVIWQNSAGLVFQSIPNFKPVMIFDSLSAFLVHQIED